MNLSDVYTIAGAYGNFAAQWSDKPLSGRRFTLAQCRKFAPELKHLSDEELLEVRDQLYEFASIIYKGWLERKATEKRQNKNTASESDKLS